MSNAAAASSGASDAGSRTPPAGGALTASGIKAEAIIAAKEKEPTKDAEAGVPDWNPLARPQRYRPYVPHDKYDPARPQLFGGTRWAYLGEPDGAAGMGGPADYTQPAMRGDAWCQETADALRDAAGVAASGELLGGLPLAIHDSLLQLRGQLGGTALAQKPCGDDTIVEWQELASTHVAIDLGSGARLRGKAGVPYQVLPFRPASSTALQKVPGKSTPLHLRSEEQEQLQNIGGTAAALPRRPQATRRPEGPSMTPDLSARLRAFVSRHGGKEPPDGQ